MSHTPSSSRFLVGALLGSFVGSLVLTFAFGSIWEGEVSGRTLGYLTYIFYAMPVMFIAFVVVGWPLFFFFRGIRFYRLGLALPAGGVTGALASVPFSKPYHSGVTLGFVAIAGFATAICWWFTNARPNPAVNTDVPPAGLRPRGGPPVT